MVADTRLLLGGNEGYSAVLALSPDHQLGFSVLVAGEGALSERWPLRAATATRFVGAAEHAAFEVARRNAAGTFAARHDGGSNATAGGTNLTITVSEDHPGLGLPEFFIGGADARINMTDPISDPIMYEGLEMHVRLYPTGLDEETGAQGGGKLVKYRAVPQFAPLGPRNVLQGGAGLFDDQCSVYLSTSFFQNAETPFGEDYYDELDLEYGPDGKVTRVLYPMWDLTFERL